MVRVIERTEAHYQTHEAKYGKVYRWCPEGVLVECDCGERLTLTSSTESCECGADYAAIIHELADREREKKEGLAPCHREYEEWLKEKAALPTEHYEWLELRSME